MQHSVYWGCLNKALHWSLKTWLTAWSYLASILYHDWFWYPCIGRARVNQALDATWGEPLRTY